MSSKIKVDTIENVAGSGNVSLGSGHNLVVPGNVTGQGTLAITGVSTLTGNVGIGITPDSISNGKALQVNRSLINDDDGGSTHITQNGYFDSAWKYVENGTAEKITFGLGATTFSSATSNSSGADASLTWVNNMVIDANGHITKPKQPAFMARISNPTPMTDLAINTNHTVTFDEEIFDQNADYNNSNYTFTAPVTGKYHFDVRLYLLEVPSNTTYVYFQLATSNRSYLMHINDVDSDQYYDFLQGSILVDMDANDTAYVYFYQPNGSTTTHIHHQNTYFTGHLVA
tara:strand:+ start:418 stop:1275 length:858 start_codon:yes stop_codon:yes gene_type:complete